MGTRHFARNRAQQALRAAGFSLMELLVADGIVGILAAIALPGYQQYVAKSRRADAKTALLDLAARQEKYFAINNHYSALMVPLGYASEGAVPIVSSGQSNYNLTMTLPAGGGFAATATPSTPAQQQDSCYAYTLNDLGAHANLTSGGQTNTSTGCW